MIINKTPHPVTILDINLVKVLKNFPVEGEPVRLAVSTQPCQEIDGFRTTSRNPFLIQVNSYCQCGHPECPAFHVVAIPS